MSSGDTPADGDTPAEFGEVNLNDHGVRAYLVKMPEFLAAEFDYDRREPGEAVGRLRIPAVGSMAAVQPSAAENAPTEEDVERPEIFVDQPIDAANTNPRRFRLAFPEQPSDMMVMSWKPSGNDPSVRVDGRVEYQCDARPPFDAAYRNINRRRVEDAAQKFRETVHMDEGERIDAQNKSVRLTALVETTSQKEGRQKQKLKKREHMDHDGPEWREGVKKLVFRMFESKLHYTADELANLVDEPVPRLRTVLNEICMYNKSGPFSGKYEVRDEYKTQAQRDLKEQEKEEKRLADIEDIKRRREERAQHERELKEPALKRTRLN